MNKRKLISILTALVMTTSLSIPAFADNLIADGDGLTSVSSNSLNIGSIEAGKSVSKTVLLAISRNGQGVNATNVFANSSTVTVSTSNSDANLNVSMPDNTIMIPSDWGSSINNTMTDSVEGLGIGTSSSTVTLTVPNGTAPGSYYEDISYTATGLDSNNKTIARNATVIVYYTVVASTDITPPIVTATPDRAANTNGWYNNDVTVSFSATDPQSTITSVDGPKTVSTEGANQVVSGSATNSASLTGTGSTTISIDKTPPTISGSTDRAANDAGWYNKDVTVSFESHDALSGVASSTAPVILGEGANKSATGTAIDLAGNSASATVSGINIDETAPTISGSADRAANDAGWYNKDVTVSFESHDALSGVASSTAPVTLGEGANKSAIGTAIDLAGNSASATVSGINIDETAPTISGSVDRAANDAGWYNKDVTVSFESNDALSGVASSTAPITLGEGANKLATGTAIDLAGNSASATVSGINIDETAPTINAEDGGTYTLNQVVTWTAFDALSGLVTPASGTIDTSKVGKNQQTITAIDNAGNTIEKAITYTVEYAFSGVLDPINANGKCVFKAGSTIPVKFQLKDAAGNYVSSAAATLSYAKVNNNIAGTDVDAISTSAATTGNVFRYDSTANQYIFNLSTKGLTAGTYQLTIKLDDSTSYYIQIGLK